MHNLATVYIGQRRFKEAEKLLRSVIQTKTRELGNCYYDTVISRNNIAQTYRLMGKSSRRELLCSEKYMLVTPSVL
jgi:hypothetical protein